MDTNAETYRERIEHVAARFGVSERTVRRWLKRTDIPHVRISGTVRFNPEAVDTWARERGKVTT